MAGTLGSLGLGGVIRKEVFDAAVLEENGQTWECESIQALSRSKCGVLIGDHKQLRKSVTEAKLQNTRFGSSLMERLAEVPGIGVCTLDQNYRSHPEVVRPFSDLIYASKVQSARKPSDFPALRGIYWPNDARLIFVDVRGSEVNSFGSYHNPEEATMVRNILEAVLDPNPTDPNTLASTFVGVISPH